MDAGGAVQMNREEIIQKLKALPYDPEEYWVLGEAGKVLQGLEKGAGEILLGCSRKIADGLEAVLREEAEATVQLALEGR